ncbi:MAG: type I glyceraldehyde-3-phosphate dehydrogenase [Candidatus Peribacteraceae bacterium]|nr:type I glyceraldehyde-3-phosphate dehydrogenase [Candidatus Peribacteraceae bacterium]
MNLAINGFGRIGRQALRIILAKHPDIEVVLINDLTDTKTLAHLFQFDSTYGTFPGKVTHTEDGIVVDGKKIRVSAVKDPAALPHAEMKVDIVIESTGRFTKREDAALHLKAGAKKVIISAPCSDKADGTFCMGVNNETYDPATMHVVSNASCTTNCLAPMVKVLNDAFGIEHGLMNTIHSYTNDQQLLDLPHKDLRRSRAAALSMIPTSTGAAKAIGLVVPEVAGKMHGVSIRVPTPTGSLNDVTVVTSKEVTAEAINEAFKKAAASGPLKGILGVEDRPIVSRDIVGDPHSCIIDLELTQVMGKNLAKIFGWYDNEWGYSNRIVELAAFMGSKL